MTIWIGCRPVAFYAPRFIVKDTCFTILRNNHIQSIDYNNIVIERRNNKELYIGNPYHPTLIKLDIGDSYHKEIAGEILRKMKIGDATVDYFLKE